MSGVAWLFGIPLAKVTQAEAVEKIIELAKVRRRPAHFVATLNVDFVSNAVPAWPFKGNKELWLYLRRSDFVVADGMPIVWLSRLARDPLPERVTGSDSVPLPPAKLYSAILLGTLNTLTRPARRVVACARLNLTP